MGSLFIRVSDPIWFHLPWDYVLANLVFEGVAWMVLGTVLAGAVRLTSR